MGKRPRDRVGTSRKLRALQPAEPRRGLDRADADRAQRARLPHPARPGHRGLYGPAASWNPKRVPDLSRREPLGAQARELAALAPDRGGLVGALDALTRAK